MAATTLTDRAIVRLSGEDVQGFLQGLVTSDVAGELPVWTGLLTPQGKCLFDFLVWEDRDDLLLDCEAEAADDLIKRVVAVAGDEVSVREGYLHINGARVDEPYLLEQGIMPDFGPEVVPPDSVFVMGDNRLVSYDSRRFGAIPMDRVLGEAVVRIWPPGRFGAVDSRP